MTDSERDRSVERLLKATPRSIPTAGPSPACLDASAIASWAERALRPDEATRVEAHLAECPRCQAVLAAFVRAEPPATHAAPAWKQWAMVLLPVATAAAAVAIWVAWPRRQSPAAPVATVAETPRVAEPRPQPAPVPPPSARSAVRAKPVGSPTRTADAITADATNAAKSAAPSMNPSPVFRSVAPPAATPVPLAAPPPAPTSAPPASAQAAARPVAIGESPLMDQRLAAAAGAGGGVRGTTEPIAAFDSPVPREGASGGGVAPAAAGGGRGGRGGGQPTTLYDATIRMSSVTRWRILASRDLERSTDDGRTWDRVAIDPPSSVTNGAAPSRLVCWLVGRAGIVLVTNDAGHFTRLDFPETVDLSAVQATDALNATVTTADGRTFVTADGGTTWTRKGLFTPRENDLRPAKP